MTGENGGTLNEGTPEGPEADELLPVDPADCKIVAQTLVQRAVRLTVASVFIVVLIIFLLVAGAFAFFFADELLVRDIARPAEALVSAAGSLTKERANFESIKAKVDSLKPIKSVLIDFDKRISVSGERLKRLDKDLENVLTQIGALSTKLDNVNNKYNETFPEERRVIERLVESGNWNKTKGAPKVWPAEGGERQRLLRKWVDSYEKKGTRKQYAFVAPLANIRKYRDRLYNEEREGERELRGHAERIAQISKVRVNGWKSVKKEIDSRIQTTITPELKTMSGKMDDLFEQSSTIVKNVKQSGDKIDQSANDIKITKEKFGNFAIYTSLLTRVSILAILVFLVQILTSMYKYNMRLASHYKARADALNLTNAGGVRQIGDLVDLLMPKNIDFGTPPKTPMEHVADSTKSFFKSRSGGTP